MTILVTGARGKIARRVIDGLRADGKDVRPASSSTLDFSDPASVESALAGVTQVFLYANPATAATFAKAADAAGAEQVVLVSSESAAESDEDPHARAEQAISSGRFATTFLRPGAFMANALRWIPGMHATGEVRLPYLDCEEAPIDDRDIADVALQVLLNAGAHDGKSYLMSGPESMTRRRQIEMIGELTGVPAKPVELTPEQWRAEMSRLMGDSPQLDVLLAYWAARVGVPHLVSGATERVTGSPARSHATWIEDNKAAFTQP